MLAGEGDDASPLPSSAQFYVLFMLGAPELYREFQVGNNPTQSHLPLLEGEGWFR